MAEQEQMGQLVLVIGDFHIPHRCAQIPKQYKEMITPNKVSAVICTGNLGCRQVYDWVKSLSPALHTVKGDFEDQSLNQIPEQKVVELAGIKIGLIHGHQVIPWGDEQALANKAKQLGVRILISGHTHDIKFSHHNDIYILNPGSMTGSYSSLKLDCVPSFIIMQIRTQEIVVYSYYLSDGQLKCIDSKFQKPQ